MSRTGLVKGEGRPYLVAHRARDATEVELGQLDPNAWNGVRFGIVYFESGSAQNPGIRPTPASRSANVPLPEKNARGLIAVTLAGVPGGIGEELPPLPGAGRLSPIAVKATNALGEVVVGSDAGGASRVGAWQVEGEITDVDDLLLP